MKSLRNSTFSPIRMLKMRSASTSSMPACSGSPSDSLIVTRRKTRLGRVHRGFPELLLVHLAETLEAFDFPPLASERPHALEQSEQIVQFDRIVVLPRQQENRRR